MSRRDDDRRERWQRRQSRRGGRGGTAERAWVARARRVGLKQQERSQGHVWRVFGRLRGLEVDLRCRKEGEGRVRYTAAVELPRLDGRLALAPESAVGALAKMIVGQDIATGDSAFDRSVLVRGDATYARAALTAPVRASVLAALDSGVQLLANRALWTWTDRPWSQKAVARAGRLAQLGARLDLQPDEELVGLLQNAVWDPEAGVRARGLSELRVDGRGTDAVVQAAAAGARDEAPEVRSAAGALILQLLEQRRDRVEVLGEPQLLAALGAAGRAPPLQILEALGRIGGAEALAQLVDLSTGVFTARDVKGAARRAAEAIRARGGAGSGALSLAAGGQGGSVALIRKPEGSLAFGD